MTRRRLTYREWLGQMRGLYGGFHPFWAWTEWRAERKGNGA